MIKNKFQLQAINKLIAIIKLYDIYNILSKREIIYIICIAVLIYIVDSLTLLTINRLMYDTTLFLY